MSSKIIIPIFPLNGAIFFPQTNLPLNIFEPRYLEMVDYALSKNKEIGMIQIKNDETLYSVGCVGKINSFDETEDGRYMINLTGISYFNLEKEILERKKFRLFEVSIINKKNKEKLIISDKDFNALVQLYISFIKKNKMNIETNFINKIDKDILVKFIAISSPFSNVEKQMLLETFNINELANKVSTLLDFYLKGDQNNIMN